MNNLPAGSTNDPLAPWNRNSRLFKHCDADEIKDVIYQALVHDLDCNNDCVDEVIEERLSEYPLCASCAKEEYYDYTED